jgi:hypothetical protein
MLSRILASTACAALLFSSAAVACPNAGAPASASGSTHATAAAKKKCKRGYHLVHKRCKRKHSHIQQQG